MIPLPGDGKLDNVSFFLGIKIVIIWYIDIYIRTVLCISNYICLLFPHRYQEKNVVSKYSEQNNELTVKVHIYM